MTGTRRALHILVMGVDERLNEVLVRNLAQWGYQAAIWEGSEPENGTPGEPADVLLIDLDGMEQERIAEDGDAGRSVAFTRPPARLTIALGSQTLRRRALEALEAVLFVPKPFDMGVLREYLMTLGRVLAGEAPPRRASLTSGERVRVLVADDDSRLTELACAMLSKDDRYIARAAHDGIEVLEQCMTWGPDCLVMDMMMPRMNGYQVLRCLQARPHAAPLPVVVLSALAGVEVRAEQFVQPSLAVLEKPIRSADLLAAVEQVLGIVRRVF